MFTDKTSNFRTFKIIRFKNLKRMILNVLFYQNLMPQRESFIAYENLK